MAPTPHIAAGDAPPVRTFSVERCPVCSSRAAEPLHRGLRDRVFGVAPGEWTLVRCPQCGTARLDPRPADDALGSLYAQYYTHGAPSPNLAPTGVAGVLRALRNAHVNARLGYDLRPTRARGRLLGRALPPFAAIAERSLRSVPLGARLLDVGCGNGEFVAVAAAAGWSAAGIDLDAPAVAAGRAVGIDLAVETAQGRARREPGAFDAVTLSHVVEHVADPIGLLRAAFDLLKPGGRLWLATPNLEAAGHRHYGADWIHLDPPRHLVLFAAEGLERALAAAGFLGVRHLRPTPTAARAWAISEAVRAGAVPADAHPVGAPRVRARAVLADLRAQLDRRRADELLILATRP